MTPSNIQKETPVLQQQIIQEQTQREIERMIYESVQPLLRRLDALEGLQPNAGENDDPLVVGEAATFYPDAPPSPPTLQKPDVEKLVHDIAERYAARLFDDSASRIRHACMEALMSIAGYSRFTGEFRASEGLRRENERLKERIGKLGWLLSGVDSQTFVGDNHERLIELAAQRIRELESNRNDLSDRQRADQYEVNLLRGQVAALESSRDAAVKERDREKENAASAHRAAVALTGDCEELRKRAEKAEGELNHLREAIAAQPSTDDSSDDYGPALELSSLKERLRGLIDRAINEDEGNDYVHVVSLQNLLDPPAPSSPPPAPVGFKKGDVVECIDDHDNCTGAPSPLLHKGKQYAVLYADDTTIGVKHERSEWSNTRFKLISSPPKVSEKEVLETPEKIAERMVIPTGRRDVPWAIQAHEYPNNTEVRRYIADLIHAERTHFQSKLDRAREGFVSVNLAQSLASARHRAATSLKDLEVSQ